MDSRPPAVGPQCAQDLVLALDTARRNALEMEAAMRTTRQLLHHLVHQCRTPLTTLLGWAQTLPADTTGKGALRTAALKIEQSTRYQARLFDDVLTASDIVSGALRLELRALPLTPEIHSAIDMVRCEIDAKSIRLRTAFDTGADSVCGDAGCLRQIIGALIYRAVKYTPRHGEVGITLRREGTRAVLAIAHSSKCGFPAQFPRLSDSLHALDARHGTASRAADLDLALARCLVEMHGGTVSAERIGERRVRCLAVRLPAMAVSAQPAHPAAAGNVLPPQDGTLLNGLRILTVDDDRNTREMLQQALQLAGAKVWASSSARDALGKLQRHRPDVLVSDIGMPREDGYALLRKVRVLPQERGGATPAIALTGYSCEADRRAAHDAGYQLVAAKPVDMAALRTAIAELARTPVRPAGRCRPPHAARRSSPH